MILKSSIRIWIRLIYFQLFCCIWGCVGCCFGFGILARIPFISFFSSKDFQRSYRLRRYFVISCIFSMSTCNSENQDRQSLLRITQAMCKHDRDMRYGGNSRDTSVRKLSLTILQAVGNTESSIPKSWQYWTSGR